MKIKMTIPLMFLLAVLLSACENEGPAERAGEQIDEVTEEIREGSEDLGNEIEDACEEMKEDMGAKDEDC